MLIRKIKYLKDAYFDCIVKTDSLSVHVNNESDIACKQIPGEEKYENLCLILFSITRKMNCQHWRSRGEIIE